MKNEAELWRLFSKKLQDLNPELVTKLLERYSPRLTRYIPIKLHPKQRLFLSSNVREALYGGAAGGGKSYCLLAAALQYVDCPDYHALILRRTYPQLSKPGALISISNEWLTGTDAKWNDREKQWSFPTGATLSFGHMEHKASHYNYQGSKYDFIAFDELTQFNETQYRYLFSRLRRKVASQIPQRMRSTANPGGIGHAWVKERFITTQDPERWFLSAQAKDNPSLDLEDYRKNLAMLDPVTRKQLDEGDWDAHIGGRFKSEWLRFYGRHGEGYTLGTQIVPVEHIRRRFLTVDPAYTEKKLAKEDPDYTVISSWAETRESHLLWLGCLRMRCEGPDIPQRTLEQYVRHKATAVYVEANGPQKVIGQLMRKHPDHPKMNVMDVIPIEDKIARAAYAANLSEAGRLWLPLRDPAFPQADVESQLLTFTGTNDAHDDIVDSLSMAAKLITMAEGGIARRAMHYPSALGVR